MDVVREETGVTDPDLLRFYALLALTVGEKVTLTQVHDAWSLWRFATRPDHRSLIPFDELDPATQAKDQPYVDGIRRAAARIAAVGGF